MSPRILYKTYLYISEVPLIVHLINATLTCPVGFTIFQTDVCGWTGGGCVEKKRTNLLKRTYLLNSMHLRRKKRKHKESSQQPFTAQLNSAKEMDKKARSFRTRNICHMWFALLFASGKTNSHTMFVMHSLLLLRTYWPRFPLLPAADRYIQ